MKGIEKEVDRLGRIVIPIEYRKRLGITAGSRVEFFLNGDLLCLEVSASICALCGNHLEREAPIRLCKSCIESIKAEK